MDKLPADVLLGCDFLYSSHALIDFSQSALPLSDGIQQTVTQFRTSPSVKRKVHLSPFEIGRIGFFFLYSAYFACFSNIVRNFEKTCRIGINRENRDSNGLYIL